MSAGTSANQLTSPRRHSGAHVGAVLAGVAAALVVWGLAELTVADLRQPGFGSADPQDLNAAIVAVAALLGGLLGWAALALLERVTARGRRLWIAAMSVALLLSLGAPLSGEGVTAGNRVALVLMHLSVAAVVLPLLYRTSPTHTDAHRTSS